MNEQNIAQLYYLKIFPSLLIRGAINAVTVEFVSFSNNLLKFKQNRTLSENGRHFCEFCENDARFPRVEFADFRKNSLNYTKSAHFQNKVVIFAKSAKMTNVSQG